MLLIGDKLLERVTTSLNDERLFDITHYWCTNVTTQNILLNFRELVHLTRLRVRGTSLSFRILVNETHQTIYSVGLSQLCSKIYLLFLLELPKIFTHYSYFIPAAPPIILFFILLLPMIIPQCMYNLHSF